MKKKETKKKELRVIIPEKIYNNIKKKRKKK